MNAIYISSLVFLVGVALVSAVADELAQSAYLDPDEAFHLHWSFNEDNITFTMTVNTTGWFGLGFSENGGMPGADIIVAGVKDGTPYLWDMHATRFTTPVKDPKQDVELISGWEKDGQTSVTFKRGHVTCDPDRDQIIGEDTMRLIYAMSPGNSDVLSYHSKFRGTRSIYLRNSISPAVSNADNDTFTIDVRSTNYEIPSNKHTMYTCELIRAPKMSTKHHLVQMEPLIKPENLGMVHHMILYGCYDDINREHFFDNDNTVHDCTWNPNMPLPYVVDICRAPVAIWAIGGGSIYYPEEVGLPFGDADSPRYFMLEVHYDNPQLLSGRFDNSGLRLTFTPNLRAYDAAVLPTGAIQGLTVPPGATDFRSTGFCSSDCTQQAFHETINVFGVALHGHLATRQVLARHFRNGKELEMLSSDRHYDFNYQQYRAFKEPKQILPGDDIMVTCHYDTSDRDKMTYGGLPTTSEMCLAYLMYYPAQNVGDCYSAPIWDINSASLAKKAGFPSFPGFSIRQTLNKITSDGFWTNEKIAIMQESYLDQPHTQMCFDRKRSYLPLKTRVYQVPEVCKTAEPVESSMLPANCTNEKDGLKVGQKDVKQNSSSKADSTESSSQVTDSNDDNTFG